MSLRSKAVPLSKEDLLTNRANSVSACGPIDGDADGKVDGKLVGLRSRVGAAVLIVAFVSQAVGL